MRCRICSLRMRNHATFLHPRLRYVPYLNVDLAYKFTLIVQSWSNNIHLKICTNTLKRSGQQANNAYLIAVCMQLLTLHSLPPLSAILRYFSITEEKSSSTESERGGSVVTHETRIREVPGSNPVAGQPG